MKIKSLLGYSKYLYLLPLLFALASCVDEVEDIVDGEEEEVEVIIDDTDFEATDWTTATHSNDADPDFDEVFDDQAVKRLDIVITEDRWQTMLDDMTNIYGNFGCLLNLILMNLRMIIHKLKTNVFMVSRS